MNFTSKTWKK